MIAAPGELGVAAKNAMVSRKKGKSTELAPARLRVDLLTIELKSDVKSKRE